MSDYCIKCGRICCVCWKGGVPVLLAIVLLASATWCFAQPLFVLPQPVAALAPAPAITNKGAFTAFWSHPTNTSDIMAYRLAWGTNAALLNNSTQVGKSITNVTVRGLEEAVLYHLSLTSVGTNGMESVPVTATNFTVTFSTGVTTGGNVWWNARLNAQ